MEKRREIREFAGALPKNRAIVEKVRKEGYGNLLFNKNDFMDAVVWAANVRYDYKDYYRFHRNRIVIPEAEVPFRKDDLVNAHFLMIIYYQKKENLVLVEELKESLFSIAKIQNVPDEDIEIMRQWDEYVQATKRKQDSGDLSANDIGVLRGTEVKYERYAGTVAREVTKFQEDLAKL